MKNPNSIVYLNQKPLMDAYLANPDLAKITDVAIIEGKDLDNPFQTIVSINEELKTSFNVGVHRAVGGLHDFPNPGDMLSASLAACFESTLRMVANRLSIVLKKTKVIARAHVDVRGTLMMSQDVTVGFQNMDLDIELSVDDSTPEKMVNVLLQATKHCCIIYQTLKKSIPIQVNTTHVNFGEKFHTQKP